PYPRTAPITALTLHDALPIFAGDRDHLLPPGLRVGEVLRVARIPGQEQMPRPTDGNGRHHVRRCRLPYAHGMCPPAVTASVQQIDRKSTRLNSSHSQMSYAVF